MKELSLKNCRLDGRYDLTHVLGRGSYSEIFAARDTFAAPNSPHNEVVIKALNVFLQGDLDAELEKTLVENFRNEAIALDRVRHPNIVSRLGHGTARDLNGLIFHYLVLEYLSGGDLYQLCKNRGVPFLKTLDYLEQICAGLSFAHSQHIIHRDMKPQNVLLTADHNTIKICDFGVARMSATDDPVTRVGTNIYAPPEHSPMMADSNVVVTQRLTPAADIYSLAKTTYVLITGESPRRFVGSAITDLPEQFAREPWAEGLLQVLRKATQYAPSLRHQSITEFWQDLVRVRIAAASAVEIEDIEDLEEVPLSEDVKPQSQVSAGYIPVAPEKPKFTTSRELKLSNVVSEENVHNPKIVVQIGQAPFNPVNAAPPQKIPQNGSMNRNYRPAYIDDPARSGEPKQKSSFQKQLRRAAVLVFLLGMFAVILYGTQAYLRGRGFSSGNLSGWISGHSEGVASSDINLRPEASARRDPIGLVPKDSRVRIVNTVDNWYEVDVIEYGRPKQDAAQADHGWVNKQYVDLR
ncbi:MAG TPA: serine/threonine-protein kinase [Pyrinomonadaceae bacterium]|jgi:serine/threonine-protein kinase|nr:serine/threonine-protein kinase [Pyrinomonadaceae bacterium]